MDNHNLSIIHLSDAIEELSICIQKFIKSEEFFDIGSDPQNEFFNSRRNMWAHLEYAEKSIQHFKDSEEMFYRGLREGYIKECR